MAGGERHHDVPRCLGGSDDDYNTVRITTSHHVLIHIALHTIFAHQGLAYTVLYMVNVHKLVNLEEIFNKEEIDGVIGTAREEAFGEQCIKPGCSIRTHFDNGICYRCCTVPGCLKKGPGEDRPERRDDLA